MVSDGLARTGRVLCDRSFPEKTEKGPHKKLLLGLTASRSYLLLHSKGQSLVLLISHLGLLERNSKKPQGLRNCKDTAKNPKLQACEHLSQPYTNCFPI